MMKVIAMILGIIMMLTITSCASISITGSTTALPLVDMIAENAPVEASVSGGGSGVGINNVLNRVSDIGMVSRDLTKEEVGLNATPIAYDGIVIVISKEVGLNNLSTKQVKEIYSGNITNWKEIGGPDHEIYVVSREYGSGTLDTFLADIMGDKKAETNGVATMVGGNGEMVLSIRGNTHAIGYVGFNYANNNTMNTIALNGISPTLDNIKGKTYILSRTLSLVTLEGNTNPEVAQFIAYELSADGQNLTREMGYIPL
jgi:phosphate transport system substrate-binding protein